MAFKTLLSIGLALILAPQAPQQAAPAATQRAAPEGYIIGPNDSLAIAVLEDQDLTSKYRVDESGMITFPYLGRVPAAGQTISQFQEELTKRLANGYINNPQVRVDVDAYKSQSVLVTGSVRSPGEITMTGQLTLLAALVRAGSPTADAGDDVQIAHNKNTRSAPSEPGAGSDEVVHVKLRDLQLGRGDMPLQDGDIIYVPPAQHFTITGQVKNSGVYVWEADLTLEQAIARAGGLTDRGSPRGAKARRTVNGKVQEVGLKLQDKVLPGDTITIGQRIF